MNLTKYYTQSGNTYNYEALELALKLNCYDTISSIQQKCWDVMYNNFCVKYKYYKGTKRFISLDKEKAFKEIGDLDKYLEFAGKIKEILDER
jgi:hypothetical protein